MSLFDTLPLAAGGPGLIGLPSFESLVGDLLDDQRDLSAVERFSRFHDQEREEGASPSTLRAARVSAVADPNLHSNSGPAASPPMRDHLYTALLPARPPGPNEQYAFEVDLDRCSGCKACVAACHALNGLDEGEAWREVGLIVGGVPGLPVLQHVTSSCHHCLSPACLDACPVDAYEKDPITGIVRHLDDQCFGCQYCTLACPYDAPKYQAAKGIVRKCDMCAGRLRDGEAPACVQACPHEAIRIRIVHRDEVAAAAESGGFLPTAPDPAVTRPTTRYRTDRPQTGPLLPADDHRLEPEHAHLPLVVMLVLTQASCGAFLADLVARAGGVPLPTALPLVGLALGLAGIGASLLHLGRPLFAYRALIGLRHSWLSREVAAFGLFAQSALLHAAILFGWPGWAIVSSAITATTGLLAVACSVMVYHAVRRPFWSATITGPKFVGTAIVLGLAAAYTASAGSNAVGLSLAIAGLLRLAMDGRILSHRLRTEPTPLRRTAELICGPLANLSVFRLGLGLLGPVAIPLFMLFAGISLPDELRTELGIVAFGVTFLAEIAERVLFFKAVVRPKMPGGLHS
jgi:Fe-S-cluster-containing dehydrogenase component/DMSO reductase anchor subunit